MGNIGDPSSPIRPLRLSYAPFLPKRLAMRFAGGEGGTTRPRWCVGVRPGILRSHFGRWGMAAFPARGGNEGHIQGRFSRVPYNSIRVERDTILIGARK
jgi:hypothetical protein